MKLRAFGLAALFVLSACGASTGGINTTFVSVPTASVVPCSALSNLRALGSSLTEVTNPSTGDSIEYTIIGDGALSKDVLVMFPGTGQILTGWPVQMLTNRTYSPDIVNSIEYSASQDGSVSLCHDYHIALFDYPGVGMTSLNAPVTRDMLSSDVDAMLNDAATRYGISTSVVDPVGWSLGTTNAIKYAMLSPVSRPARTIRNVILIAANPGASLQGQVGENSAPCVTSLFAADLTATGTEKTKLGVALTSLTFPYVGQTQSDSGTNSGCTATFAGGAISLSVTPDCTASDLCEQYIESSAVDIQTYPWSQTGGIDQAVFVNERELSNDFDVAYCSGASANFTSSGCTSYGTVDISESNGGVCRTNTTNPNSPVSSSCDPLKLKGKLVVINGYEDLLTQWTYGQALVNAYAGQLGAANATLETYPGSAGHGVMIEYPMWTQAQIYAAMR